MPSHEMWIYLFIFPVGFNKETFYCIFYFLPASSLAWVVWPWTLSTMAESKREKREIVKRFAEYLTKRTYFFFYEPVATEHQSHLLVSDVLWPIQIKFTKLWMMQDISYWYRCTVVPSSPHLFNSSSQLWVRWVTPATGEDFSSEHAKLSNV